MRIRVMRKPRLHSQGVWVAHILKMLSRMAEKFGVTLRIRATGGLSFSAGRINGGKSGERIPSYPRVRGAVRVKAIREQ